MRLFFGLDFDLEVDFEEQRDLDFDLDFDFEVDRDFVVLLGFFFFVSSLSGLDYLILMWSLDF